MPDVQPITIGYNPEFGPFGFEDNGSAHGLVIERVSTAFKRAGIPFVFAPIKLPEMIATLDAGRVLCDKVFPDLFMQLNADCLAFPLAIATKAGDPFNIIHRLNAHILDEWSGENWF